MKFLIGLIIVVGLSLGGYQLYNYYDTIQQKSAPPPPPNAAPAAPEIDGNQLQGLPQALDGPLHDAEQRGAAALKQFLAAHGNEIKDPRRAWIELDYVVLAGTTDPAEARRVYFHVKDRITPGSPVYGRFKQLQKTYE